MGIVGTTGKKGRVTSSRLRNYDDSQAMKLSDLGPSNTIDNAVSTNQVNEFEKLDIYRTMPDLKHGESPDQDTGSTGVFQAQQMMANDQP